MPEEAVTNEPQQPASAPDPKPEETDAVKSAPVTLNEDDLKKYLKGRESKDIANILTDLIQGQKIAAVYIDARSGGVFFNGDARISGDVVGHGQSKRSGQSAEKNEQAAVGQVLANDLKKINAVYVQSPLHNTAAKKIKKSNLLILHGRAHTGKWTTAIELLSQLHEGNVVELDPAAKQEQLIDSIVEARGYIVDTMSVETAEHLTPFFLGRLSDRLQDKNAHLAITLDERITISKDIVNAYVIAWDATAEPVEILKKHLAWYAPDASGKDKNKILAEQDVQSLLQVRFLPGEIDRLAELLGDVLNGNLDLKSALARFTARAREQVKNWFDENDDLDDRLFMLSVAVFNGASYQAVTDSEKRLRVLFPEDDKPASPASVFGSSRGQRVRRAGAQLKQGYAHNEIGRVPVEIIELDNPSIQPAVLQFAWDEYDRLREIMAKWLHDSALASSFDVRMRAAAAVGELSKYDFNDIRGKIILSWANHVDTNVRTAAALALGIPAWDSETAPMVLNLLHHWSTLKNNWKLCWTACVSYGGLVGLRFPDAALRDLHQITQAGDLRLLNALMQSMNNLFDAGETVSEYRQKVMNALSEWAEKSKTIEGIFALFIFLSIAEFSRQKADPEGAPWPTLLWLAGNEDAFAAQIAVLWQKAFNLKASRSTAFTVFEDWLKLAQKDMRLDKGCIYLAKEIARGEERGKEGRLKAHLLGWQEKTDTEQIAKKILKEI